MSTVSRPGKPRPGGKARHIRVRTAVFHVAVRRGVPDYETGAAYAAPAAFRLFRLLRIPRALSPRAEGNGQFFMPLVVTL